MSKRKSDPYLCELRDAPSGNRCGKKAFCTTQLLIVAEPGVVGFIMPATWAHMCLEHVKKLQPPTRPERKRRERK